MSLLLRYQYKAPNISQCLFQLPSRLSMTDQKAGKALQTSAEARLSSISSHLQAKQTTMSERPFITCHVLDTISGKPGASIDVKLKLISPVRATTAHWTATTNSDGRVPEWTSSANINEVVSKVKAELADGDQMVWSLAFDTEKYFGKGKTFWPEVELRFAAQKEEHYHVPLLLGPWSYTTYRGS